MVREGAKSMSKVRIGEGGRGFLSGVSYLTVSALLVKVIGLLYRIPMLTYLGTEGMGYFNTAYELYALFCIISTAGLPVAMSVMISKGESLGEHHRVGRIFHVSFMAFWVMGLVGSLVLFGFADALSHLLKNEGAAWGMRMIAPTVLLICLSSAFRGYFQGKRYMAPTALSQVIEALGKLILGVLFAAYAQGQGYALPMVAAYAVLGLTVGTGISVIYLWLQKIIYDRKHPILNMEENVVVSHSKSDLKLLKELTVIAIPVTLGAGVMGVTKLIDLTLILRRLQDMGMGGNVATSLYGCYTTLAVPVFNMLPSLTTSISLSVVPALSGALGQGSEGRGKATKLTLSALRMTLTVAIPAALGLSVFSGEILTLLFGHQPEAVAQATPWLSCLALAVPASCLITVTGALLQAIGHPERPVIAMLVGIVVKSVSAYLLIGNPNMGMMGAPVSTMLCDTAIVLTNLIFLARLAPWLLPSAKQSVKLFLLPTVLSIVSVGCVVGARHLFGWTLRNPVVTIGSIVMVMCLYGGAWLILLSREQGVLKKKTVN